MEEIGAIDHDESEVDWREPIHRKHQGHYVEHLGFVGRDLEELSDKASLDTVWTGYTCSACGAFVRDRGLHDRWGTLMNQLLERVDELEQDVAPLLPPRDMAEAMEQLGEEPN